MQTLNLDPMLSPAPIKRPASQFPERADVYFCDKCRRDITTHLYRGRSHVRQPLGPVRYVCRCGQSYLCIMNADLSVRQYKGKASSIKQNQQQS
jgi:hypothetical protein